MHRSASASRVSGEFVVQSSSVAPSLDGADQLPTYDPLSHAAKKERSRLRSAENAVHLIPLVLIFCAVILWFFSSPGRFMAKTPKGVHYQHYSEMPLDS